MDRTAAIRERLEKALQPSQLDITDESRLHIGHAGHGGGGHFRICIVSAQFRERPTLARHRMVYAALGDLMPDEIHALGIKALTADEQD